MNVLHLCHINVIHKEWSYEKEVQAIFRDCRWISPVPNNNGSNNLKEENMEHTELTSLGMHEMIHNVLYFSRDSRLIRNIAEALEHRSYKGIFQVYGSEIIAFNQQFNNNKSRKIWKKKTRK